MRIALLQDDIYLPSFAGGIKANRCLMESFADAGHKCLVFARALTSSQDGPNDLPQFQAEMDSRRISVTEIKPGVFSYEFRQVQVEALSNPDTNARGDYLTHRIREFQPDGVLVADDKRRFMLSRATAAAPGRVIPMLQTIMQLPFGPLSVDHCERQTTLMRDAPANIVISRFMQRYIRQYGQMESHVLPLPVYGPGPFSNLARHDAGFVTMINPCQYKGVAIFQALANRFPQLQFAAVPTWGADDHLRNELRRPSNVQLLAPSDNIEDILRQTRILLVPSLWPETFGYVVPEAMLRGIPVLASNLGGLPEAKLGVDYLLPVTPAERHGHSYVCPAQDSEPWRQAIVDLLEDAETYQRCSRESREAAMAFVSQVSIESFETLLTEIPRP